MKKIVFGIMSAVHSSSVVSQLSAALAPFPVVIHHDFSQTPDFQVSGDNVGFVPDPARTGWDDWGFTAGLTRLLEHVVHTTDADYFQLLSPTCLPVQPMAAFAAHVRDSDADVHFDAIALRPDPDVLVNYAYRTFLPAGTWRARALLKGYLARYHTRSHLEMRSNLQLRVVDDGADARPGPLLGLALARLASAGVLGAHPFKAGFEPWVGGTWFGATRRACEHLLEGLQDPAIIGWFSRIPFADEVLIATLFRNSTLRHGPGNHLVNDFVEARPGWFEPSDYDRIMTSGRFFARKFADDADSPLRQRVLATVRGAG